MGTTHVLAISGSLRVASHNSALLRAAQELTPPGMEVEIYGGIGSLPHYDQDLEAEPPESVQTLRTRIHEADGLLIATPEYNYGPPGALKNAIDWASRPAASSPLLHKPIALASAAPTNSSAASAHSSPCARRSSGRTPTSSPNPSSSSSGARTALTQRVDWSTRPLGSSWPGCSRR